MGAAADLTAAVAAVRAVAARFHTASDGELLADAEAVEVLGRIVDGLRLGAAAQLEHRSRKRLGEESLAFRQGKRDGVELVQHLAGISHTAAKQRVGLGAALAPAVGLTGELLPGRYPALSEAVASGAVGIESARAIVTTMHPIRRRAAADDLDAMLDSLVGIARWADTDLVRETAADWALAIDPDGVEPTERARRRKRALRLGHTLSDGTTRLSVVLLPEHLALVKELLHSRRRAKPLFRTAPGGDDTCEDVDPEWREAVAPDDGDSRSRAQEDYDTFAELLDVAAKAEQDGSVSTAVTHETVITVSAADVLARNGQGWAPGIMAGLPMPLIEQKACTGGLRLLVTGPDGEALYLSRSHRVFTTAQKKALTIAAGGRCQYPGCTTPAPFLEAHHAEWWHRDGGDTSVDNGIMLCSHHHHLVHAKHSPVEIRRVDGDMFIVPRSWRGPLQEHQRRQRGPTADPDLIALQRRNDPGRNPFAA